MTSRYGIVIALAVIVMALAPACTDSLPKEFPAPDFTLKEMFSGEEITLSAYRGRPVLLYFFASW